MRLLQIIVNTKLTTSNISDLEEAPSANPILVFFSAEQLNKLLVVM